MVSGSLYWDILRLFHEMKQGILKCAASGHKDIASIGIDTWGVDFGLLDSTGSLIGNSFHYRDSRTEGMIEEACRIVPGQEIYQKTGVAFQVFNTLYQLFSMKFNNSPVLEQASTMLYMPDLLRYFLTGEKNCEYTIASTSQMLDAHTRSWAADLLGKLGIPLNIMTEIIDAGTIAGKLTSGVAGELGVGQVPVVAVAEHDTGSAVVSVPAEEGKYAYLSSGTWSLLGVELAVPVINDQDYGVGHRHQGSAEIHNDCFAGTY